MNTTYENLVSTTLSTPMVYYNSYHYSPEEIELRYGAIKFGSAEDLSEYFKAGVNALESKNLSMAISNFTKVAEMVPSFLPAINNLGTLYYNIGRLPEAIHFFEQGISKDPKNFQVRYNLGTLYCLNQNFQQAKDQL
jgi:tetratricopeptide (TPR) repeat protein